MHISFLLFAGVWCVLALFVVGLAIYRKLVSRKEDDYIHLDSGVSAQQALVDRKLTLIDRWGKSLTVAAVVYGVIVGGLYIYRIWRMGPSS